LGILGRLFMDVYACNISIFASDCALETVGDFVGLFYGEFWIEVTMKDDMDGPAEFTNLDSVNFLDFREAFCHVFNVRFQFSFDSCQFFRYEI